MTSPDKKSGLKSGLKSKPKPILIHKRLNPLVRDQQIREAIRVSDEVRKPSRYTKRYTHASVKKRKEKSPAPVLSALHGTDGTALSGVAKPRVGDGIDTRDDIMGSATPSSVSVTTEKTNLWHLAGDYTGWSP